MISLASTLALVLANQSLQTAEIPLSRGYHFNGGRAVVPGDDIRVGYWDVFEAEIDAAAPTLPISTMYALTGNVNRHVLMRFGLDEFQAIGDGVEATLVLTLVEPEKANLKSIRILRKPWMTPPANSLGKRVKTPKAGDPVPFAPGVTWTKAGGDVSNWEKAGALGTSDSTIVNAEITKKDNKLYIKGLGKTVAEMMRYPGANFGFMLEFSGETGIWSSLSPESRPQLVLKGVEQIKPNQAPAEVAVSKVGDGTVTIFSPKQINKLKVRQGTDWIYEGPAKALTLGKSKSKDSRASMTTIVVDLGEKEHVVTLDPNGPWAPIDHFQANWLRSAIDASVYSFAPTGAGRYINPTASSYHYSLENAGLGAHEIYEVPTDLSLLLALVPPPKPTSNPLFKQLAQPVVGPLPMSTVDELMHGTRKLPSLVIAKVVNPDGVAIPGTKVVLDKFKEGIKPEVYTADAKGFIFITLDPNTLVPLFGFDAAFSDSKDSIRVAGAYFTNQYARGNTTALSFELPFNLPLLPVQRDTNLAYGKPTKDSKGSFPAQLIALTDGKVETEFKLSPGEWVEIDLGRDRLLAEFTWNSPQNAQFEVVTYGTGEKAEEAVRWFEAMPPDEGPQDKTVYPTPAQARFVRIKNTGKSVFAIGDIKLFAGKRG
jgi:hypothetical protein